VKKRATKRDMRRAKTNKVSKTTNIARIARKKTSHAPIPPD
jgi:hypothetical protein